MTDSEIREQAQREIESDPLLNSADEKAKREFIESVVEEYRKEHPGE